MNTLNMLCTFAVTLLLGIRCWGDSTGTGFFVSEDGYVVTNYHVVEGSSQVLFKHLDVTLPARIVAVDRENDIALLKTPKGDKPFSYMSVNSAALPSPGSDVFTVGFPDPTVLGLTPKTTTGSVTASAGIKDDPRFLQISVPIQPGNSGGPLVDASGNVIGITTATIDAINRLKDSGYLPQNINYALKASYLKGVFDQVRDSRLGVSSSEPRERKFEEIQRATEQSVALIIAISQAPPRRSEGSSAPPQPDQPVQEEEVPPITYIGHVGQLDAIFFLKWLPGGKIQGTYFYPKRGINRSYTLLGENSEDGKIYLEEYTDKALTARIGLVKSITAREIVWEGAMQNVDGRRFEMSFRRDR
jgi:Trypsin-like peptidase domain